MKSIGEWFDEYSESHQNPINKKNSLGMCSSYFIFDYWNYCSL